MRMMMLAGLALAAVPATAQAQTEPAMKGPFYELGGDARSTSAVAMGSRSRDGDTAFITRSILLRNAAKVGELMVWRLDATVEFDCKKKLTRPTVLAGRDDKGALVHMFAPQDPLEPVPDDATTLSVMAVACDGKPPTGVTRIDDFSAYQAAFHARP